jgi:TPR repeat protein
MFKRLVTIAVISLLPMIDQPARAVEAAAAVSSGNLSRETKVLIEKAEAGDAQAQYSLGAMYYEGRGVAQDYKEAAKWFARAAEQGYAEAQRQLGFMYEGIGVAKDFKEAVKWYTRAAKQGNARAQYDLGVMYEYGFGVARDDKEAVKWYTKASEQGWTPAQYVLGKMYYEGRGVAQDYKEAVKWYTKLAEQGFAPAQYNLGNMYSEGQGVKQDYKQAVKWYTKAAEQEHAGAQFSLGWMYGVTRDDKKAVEWYAKAAEQGDVPAQYNLGKMYCAGRGVAQDYKEAAKWYAKAAEQGFASAQYNLGLMYYAGRGVVQDYKEAAKWFAKAAEQGDVASQHYLGLVYSKGEGVTQDDKEAAKWIARAAEQGYAEAQYSLGGMYGLGKGVTQDDKEAAKWFARAAEQGHASAQRILGSMYYEGKGVIEDYVEAYKWALLAGMNGKNVAGLKQSLGSKMMPSQITEAQKLAREFKPKKQSSNEGTFQTENRNKTPKSSGTGFIITTDGYIVTAGHVIQDAQTVTVVTKNEMLPATIVVKSLSGDIALLKITGDGYPAIPIKSSKDIQLGANVFTVGYPNVGIQGFEPKFTMGNISSLAGIQDNPLYFQVSIPVQPGNSGGPLVDEDGNIVGAIVAKLNDAAMLELTGSLPQNVNYALKSSFILAMLETTPDIYKKMPKPNVKKQMPLEKTVDQTSASVVLILAN